MITSAEARLGKNMSLVAAIGIVLTIVINVATGAASGAANSYDSTWGPIDNLINFAQDVASVFVVVLAMKLFAADEKPGFRVMSYMMIVINTMWAVRDLAPTAVAITIEHAMLKPITSPRFAISFPAINSAVKPINVP